MSGSVNRGKDNSSQSIQMIERPLMTPDELKNLPKGTFVVMKTAFHPMKVKLKLFFKWGINFEEPYTVEENGNREVQYANRKELFDAVINKYHPELNTSKKIEESEPHNNKSNQAKENASENIADKKPITVKVDKNEEKEDIGVTSEINVKTEHKPNVAKSGGGVSDVQT